MKPKTETPSTSVYAYSVKGVYFHDLRHAIKPFFVHFWIDADLQYQECIKDTADMPPLDFLECAGFQVELRGPSDFTINSTR